MHGRDAHVAIVRRPHVLAIGHANRAYEVFRRYRGIPGARDVRGRRTFTFSTIDAFIEQRPALDRSTLTTERADDTVLTFLDPLAITDEHLFRWGEPPHTYRIKAVDGVIQDAETGTRFASEVTVIR